jgi:hypothetical protein
MRFDTLEILCSQRQTHSRLEKYLSAVRRLAPSGCTVVVCCKRLCHYRDRLAQVKHCTKHRFSLSVRRAGEGRKLSGKLRG